MRNLVSLGEENNNEKLLLYSKPPEATKELFNYPAIGKYNGNPKAIFNDDTYKCTAILRKRWANFFTDAKLVRVLVAAVMPIMGEFGSCPQMKGCGILCGTARPDMGTITLWSFNCIGTLVAVGPTFWLKIGFDRLWYSVEMIPRLTVTPFAMADLGCSCGGNTIYIIQLYL
ncbi:hypothetical protein NE237_014188 [Protea cynaroides]|uniref:Uncharacterized protein n=1 Tax=Protea cynaroides TaxID=273540 RepID=A0A9Q0GKD7_9MAGN|nr:hypothetical protein NE237_014188 [Protea cynaroides]